MFTHAITVNATTSKIYSTLATHFKKCFHKQLLSVLILMKYGHVKERYISRSHFLCNRVQ